MWKIKWNLIDGSNITLLSVIHILGLDINFIFVRKMNDAGAKIVFEKFKPVGWLKEKRCC
jgi:hypothetical protein